MRAKEKGETVSNYLRYQIREQAAELTELRQFVGAMLEIKTGENVGRWSNGQFCIFNKQRQIITVGTDPFDAWRKMQEK